MYLLGVGYQRIIPPARTGNRDVIGVIPDGINPIPTKTSSNSTDTSYSEFLSLCRIGLEMEIFLIE